MWENVQKPSTVTVESPSWATATEVPDTLARQPADDAAAAATAATTAVAVRPSTAVESRVPAPVVQQEAVRSFLYPGDDELPDDVNMTIWEHLAGGPFGASSQLNVKLSTRPYERSH